MKLIVEMNFWQKVNKFLNLLTYSFSHLIFIHLLYNIFNTGFFNIKIYNL